MAHSVDAYSTRDVGTDWVVISSKRLLCSGGSANYKGTIMNDRDKVHEFFRCNPMANQVDAAKALRESASFVYRVMQETLR